MTTEIDAAVLPAAWDELVAQMREMEVLLEATSVPATHLTDYWQVATDVLVYREDLPVWQQQALDGSLTRATIRALYLRALHTLRALQARTLLLSRAADSAPDSGAFGDDDEE